MIQNDLGDINALGAAIPCNGLMLELVCMVQCDRHGIKSRYCSPSVPNGSELDSWQLGRAFSWFLFLVSAELTPLGLDPCSLNALPSDLAQWGQLVQTMHMRSGA